MDCVTSYHPKSIYNFPSHHETQIIIGFQLLSMYANCSVHCFQWMKNVDFPYILNRYWNSLQCTLYCIVRTQKTHFNCLTNIDACTLAKVGCGIFHTISSLGWNNVKYSTSLCQRKGSATHCYWMLLCILDSEKVFLHKLVFTFLLKNRVQIVVVFYSTTKDHLSIYYTKYAVSPPLSQNPSHFQSGEISSRHILRSRRSSQWL